LRKWR